MILYVDRELVPDREQIDPELLRWCVRKGEQAAGRMARLDRYYRGDHDIFHSRNQKNQLPLAVNYAKYVVDIALGYYLGRPVKYDPNPRSWRGGEEGESPWRRDRVELTPLLRCYDRQHISALDREIGKTTGVMGECLELCYASGDLDPYPKSARIDPRNGILVCDSTVEHEKLFALLWERREKPSGERYYAVSLYTDHTRQDYTGGDLETAPFLPVGEAEEHYFGSVPVIAYENNAERQGDFEQILSLIDAYDQLMSDRIADKKQFVDALLVFFGMTLAPGEEEKFLREKFIDGAPLDARVEYIQKTFDESGVQVLADALVREMHKMTLTVDMSDEHFSGNSSGQALKLKLLTMDQLVQGKIARMEQGLRERLALYSHWLSVKGEMAEIAPEDVDVVFTLNLPVNEAEQVELVTRLRGMVDDQTLLSQLWFIRDPAEAVKNLRVQENSQGTPGEIACSNRNHGTGRAQSGNGTDRKEV